MSDDTKALLMGRLRNAGAPSRWNESRHELQDLCAEAADTIERLERELNLVRMGAEEIERERLHKVNTALAAENARLREAERLLRMVVDCDQDPNIPNPDAYTLMMHRIAVLADA